MRKLVLSSLIAGAALVFGAAAYAQPAPAPAAIPQYGTPGVNLAQAKAAIAAAVAEAQKNNWPVAIAVVSNGGYLVAFEKIDNTQLASVKIAIHKARVAATYRRPTKAFEDRVAAGGAGLAVLALDDIIASEGGIPLMKDGKIIGAIGVSGVLSSQDGQVAKAGADTVK